MKIAVIIAEYNPFHNGHAYHIEQTRRLGATHIAVVMSGNFVQRGEPAFLDKHIRAEAALRGGADLVLELPLPFACAPAERFARGAVALADGLGCAELLSFGSECGDMQLLRHTAAVCRSPDFRRALKAELSQGRSYAAAQQRALAAVGQAGGAALLGQPNDTLALEYIQALHARGSSIRPVAVPRRYVGHDAPATGDRFASAGALRTMAADAAGGVDSWARYVPDGCLPLYTGADARGLTPDPARADLVLLTLLRSLPEGAFDRLPDCSEGVERRLMQALGSAVTYRQLLDEAKTKRYTHARLRRLALAGALGIPQVLTQGEPAYLRVLGANARGTEILSACKGAARLPVAHSLAGLARLEGRPGEMARLEGRSTALYNLMLRSPRAPGTDYTDAAVWLR